MAEDKAKNERETLVEHKSARGDQAERKLADKELEQVVGGVTFYKPKRF